LSKNNCIFGGYTPIAWTSRGTFASDPSLQSFLFTIKNPHNLPARIFKQNRAENAIADNGGCGPSFGSAWDLYVCDQCHGSNGSHTDLSTVYTNDTGIPSRQVFTGDYNFTAEELEVFEVV
jgi:hypothetical protein